MPVPRLLKESALLLLELFQAGPWLLQLLRLLATAIQRFHLVHQRDRRTGSRRAVRADQGQAADVTERLLPRRDGVAGAGHVQLKGLRIPRLGLHVMHAHQPRLHGFPGELDVHLQQPAAVRFHAVQAIRTRARFAAVVGLQAADDRLPRMLELLEKWRDRLTGPRMQQHHIGHVLLVQCLQNAEEGMGIDGRGRRRPDRPCRRAFRRSGALKVLAGLRRRAAADRSTGLRLRRPRRGGYRRGVRHVLDRRAKGRGRRRGSQDGRHVPGDLVQRRIQDGRNHAVQRLAGRAGGQRQQVGKMDPVRHGRPHGRDAPHRGSSERRMHGAAPADSGGEGGMEERVVEHGAGESCGARPRNGPGQRSREAWMTVWCGHRPTRFGAPPPARPHPLG